MPLLQLSKGINHRADSLETRLRVMTYNLFKGAQGREAGLLKIIRAVEPDILFLQEVAGEATIQCLAERLGFHYAVAHSRNGPKNLALLSRYPVIHNETHLAFPLFHAVLLTTIQLPTGEQINLYGVHLGVLYDWWRSVELFAILRRIRQFGTLHPSSSGIIAGDFNAILPGDNVHLRAGTRIHKMVLFFQFAFATRIAPRVLEHARWVDSYRACHSRDNGFTFPASAPAVRLDRIYTTPAFAQRLARCDVITHPGETRTVSDHFPLIAEFEMDNRLPNENR